MFQNFQNLGVDHVSWLLAAANTFLQQQKTDRAIVLLEFLGLFDPNNVQGQKMLAYALLLTNDRQGCRAALSRLARYQLNERDRNAVEMLSARLDGSPHSRQLPSQRA